MAVAPVFLDSCDHLLAASAAPGKWVGSSGTVASILTDTRFGVGRAYRSPFDIKHQQITPNVSAWIVSFAWRPSTYSTRVAAITLGGTVKSALQYSGSGTLQLLRGTTVLAESTYRPKQGVWIHLEWAVFLDSTVGTSELRLNGSEVLFTFTGDTSNGAGEVGREASLGHNLAGAHDYDDAMVRAGASYAGSDFLGDVHVKAYYPTADGNYTAWTPQGGGAHFVEVDDPQNDDDTTYVSTGTVGNTDSFAVENLDAGKTILVVQAAVRSRDQTGSSTIIELVRIGGVDFLGTGTAGATTYLGGVEVWQSSPATGLPWTEAEFNGAELGFRKTV
jgi:hypothetical protein